MYEKHAGLKGKNFIKISFFKFKLRVLKSFHWNLFFSAPRSVWKHILLFIELIAGNKKKEKLKLMKRKVSKCTNVSPAPGCLEGPPCYSSQTAIIKFRIFLCNRRWKNREGGVRAGKFQIRGKCYTDFEVKASLKNLIFEFEFTELFAIQNRKYTSPHSSHVSIYFHILRSANWS